MIYKGLHQTSLKALALPVIKCVIYSHCWYCHRWTPAQYIPLELCCLSPSIEYIQMESHCCQGNDTQYHHSSLILLLQPQQWLLMVVYFTSKIWNLCFHATDVMEMDDGPDMDMGDGYYSDHNDNTTPKSHLATRRVSHVISSDSYYGIITLNTIV